MGTKDFVKRSIKYIFKGIPENKTYVNITVFHRNSSLYFQYRQYQILLFYIFLSPVFFR